MEYDMVDRRPAASKIGGKQIKKNAIAAKHIKNKAVKAPKIANNAKAMWAAVSADGTEIAAQSGGISAVPGEFAGYHVKFPRSAQGKATVATPLSAGPLGSPTGDVGVKVKPCGSGPIDGGIGCTFGDGTRRDVYVFTHDDGSSQEAGFYIAVLP